jgi:hypothetical protein
MAGSRPSSTLTTRAYRAWSHELPPLRHRDRGSTLDVHHTILPPRSRLRPDPSAFWRSAVTLRDGSLAFCPTHMALHAAVHLFQDGEITGGFGDIIDFDQLCRHFGQDLGYWHQLLPAAAELGLVRPLFYSLRYASLLLGTPVPGVVMKEAARFGKPPLPVTAAMDPLVRRALVPDPPEDRSPWRWVARLCLYIRSTGCVCAAAAAGADLMCKAWVRGLLLPDEIHAASRQSSLPSACATRPPACGADRGGRPGPPRTLKR